MSSEATGVSLRVSRTIQAPRAEVFRAWTSPEELRRWHAPGDMAIPLAEVDLRVGGEFKIRMQAEDGPPHTVTGVYREIDPPRRLVYSWSWVENEAHAGAETQVTVEFEERRDATEVILTHEGFPTDEARDSHNQGWVGILERMAGAV